MCLIVIILFPITFSKKFWRKVNFIPTLQDLSVHVKVDEDYISAPVVAVDKSIMSRRPTSQKYQAKKSSSASGSRQKDDSDEPVPVDREEVADRDTENDVPSKEDH